MSHFTSLAAGACALVFAFAHAAPAPDGMDALVASHYRSAEPGAVVLVSQAGMVLLRKSYGMASLELDVPMQPDHVFRIGSISKTFTAVAVMQLVDRGALALDAPIGRYLPHTPASWAKITVEHLLVHAAGIPNLEHAPGFKGFQVHPRSVDEVIAYFRDEPLDFVAGTKTSYSSSGYIVLGKLVEVVSGQRYEDYLLANIIKPLGLSHTAYGTETRVVRGMVTGYQDRDARAGFVSMTVPHGAGALISNADDLARFADALHNGRLVSAASYARMVKPYVTSLGKTTIFGMGLVLRELDDKILIGHNGAIEGFSADLEYEAESRTTVVVLQNQDGNAGLATRVSERLMTALATGRR